MKTKYIILLLSTVLLFASCCKKIPPPEFSADQKAWQPYHEGQKIYFKSEQTGDTLSFYVEKITHTESEGQDCSNENNDQEGSTGYSVHLVQFGQYPESLLQYDYNKFEGLRYKTGLSIFNNNYDFHVYVGGDIDINSTQTLNINNIIYQNSYRYLSKFAWESIDTMIVAKNIGIIGFRFKHNEYYYLNK